MFIGMVMLRLGNRGSESCCIRIWVFDVEKIVGGRSLGRKEVEEVIFIVGVVIVIFVW